MSSRMKEEKRIERIIRGLLKQPDNRRCINCNTLGPQYVCTTFWTFICTNCSGIHREFTHRVKSVSMAKFTADEVSSLQAGGNERARQIYFKTWDPSRNFYPDSSNLNKLREFIRQVYMDRRFLGNMSQDNKLSNVKVGSKDMSDERGSFERSTPSAKEGFVERHSFESSSLGNRLSFEKFNRGGREGLPDRCSSEKWTTTSRNGERGLRYCLDQLRNPRCTQEQTRQKNRPARFEIVDDRFREDELGNVKRYEHYRLSRAESRHGSRSPDSRRGMSEASSPVVRPVKDISGDKTLESKVCEPLKPKEGKEIESYANDKKIGSSTNSSSSVNAKANQNEVKLISLIDFDADPQSLTARSTQSTQPIAASNDTNEKAPVVDSLESLLFGLSSAFVTPPDITSVAPVVDDATTANPEIVPPGATAEMLALPAPKDAVVVVYNQQNLHSTPNMQVQPSALVLYNQHSAPEPCPSYSERAAFSCVAPRQSSQLASSTPARDACTGNDVNSSGRKELPAELFTSSYAPFAAASSGWQYHSPHGMMGYGMQYQPNAARVMVSTKSRNPFDVGDESPQVSAPTFSSMLTLQGMPNISPSPPFQPQPLPYAFPSSPQLPTPYGMALPAGAYLGQHLTNNMLITRHEESNSSETGEESSFASLNPLHHSNGAITYRMPNASYPSSNPFT